MNPNVFLFPECGKGFQFVPGQGDHSLGTYSHLSTRKCADICNLLDSAEENTICCSYELDHEEKKCVVNQVLPGANFGGGICSIIGLNQLLWQNKVHTYYPFHVVQNVWPSKINLRRFLD